MEYVVKGAKMACSQGTSTPPIGLSKGHGIYAGGLGLIITTDNKKGENIPSFGKCSLLQNQACKYSPAGEWQNPCGVFMRDTLGMDSRLFCCKGGTITFTTSGQK